MVNSLYSAQQASDLLVVGYWSTANILCNMHGGLALQKGQTCWGSCLGMRNVLAACIQAFTNIACYVKYMPSDSSTVGLRTQYASFCILNFHISDLAQNSISVGKEKLWNGRSGFQLCISAHSFKSKLWQCKRNWWNKTWDSKIIWMMPHECIIMEYNFLQNKMNNILVQIGGEANFCCCWGNARNKDENKNLKLGQKKKI